MKLCIVLLALLFVTEGRLLSSAQPTYAGPQGWGGHSARAVDGNKSGHWAHKSCTHSKVPKGSGNWWKVDLGKPHSIERVRIWNRARYGNRINGAEVYASGHLCGTVKYSGKRFQDVNCNGRFASQVTIRQLHNHLTLCEVEVFGDSPVRVEHFKLLSHKQPTKSGPQGWGGKSSRAVDGNTSGSWKHGSCTHSKAPKGTGNWWRVDFKRGKGPYRIHTVRIWNRKDCCSERIHGAQVYAGRHQCGVVHYAGDHFHDVDCGGREARHVTIRQPHNYLTLCEVQVYGQGQDEDAKYK